MLKKIPVSQVREGMFVHKFCGSWLQHPFWSSKLLIADAATLARIRASSIKELIIDLSRGCDVASDPLVPPFEPDADADSTVIAGNHFVDMASQQASPSVLPTSFTEEIRQARDIVNRGKEAVITMFADARLGRTLETAGLNELLDDMSASISRNSHALISVARIKRKDEYTYLHSVAVAAMMIGMARQLELDEETTRLAGMAGLLHDLGKAMTPEDILNKPGKLTDEEFAVMREHPVLGHQLLQSWAGVPEAVLDVCLHHHEKVDGSGYPWQQSGEQISLLSRIGAICDVYDAVTSNRPYKAGWDPAVSISRMTSWQGHFDSALLQSFVRMLGIYPVGSLVKLASNQLAVVIEQHAGSLLTPKVNVFYAIKLRQKIAVKTLDLADNQIDDRIVSRENPQDWGLQQLEKLWLPD
ncbi:HD-GYP domain-containing protein [Halopseudomonas salegens]|uniref:HDIG domain-containing protein n=1 Tax=Halopseudomonas salegens TaxID=1434072 RepID=A0A1H2EJQ7_9GAMM|nr:HD-GYP domain-containing protein [Halopseudomonas salegens]SDT95193.1 HDIG domain-containing protein [Halopseudomonas salegens]